MNRRPGDWNCSFCQHHNFSWRDSCQQCGGPRVFSTDYTTSATADGGGCSRGSNFRPGDWFCLCGSHNFASRSSCVSCGAFNDTSLVGSTASGGFHSNSMLLQGSPSMEYGGGGWKPGDWLCTRWGCNQHNFASRKECYRCKAPKGFGTYVVTALTLISIWL